MEGGREEGSKGGREGGREGGGKREGEGGIPQSMQNTHPKHGSKLSQSASAGPLRAGPGPAGQLGRTGPAGALALLLLSEIQ